MYIQTPLSSLLRSTPRATAASPVGSSPAPDDPGVLSVLNGNGNLSRDEGGSASEAAIGSHSGGGPADVGVHDVGQGRCVDPYGGEAREEERDANPGDVEVFLRKPCVEDGGGREDPHHGEGTVQARLGASRQSLTRRSR